MCSGDLWSAEMYCDCLRLIPANVPYVQRLTNECVRLQFHRLNLAERSAVAWWRDCPAARLDCDGSSDTNLSQQNDGTCWKVELHDQRLLASRRFQGPRSSIQSGKRREPHRRDGGDDARNADSLSSILLANARHELELPSWNRDNSFRQRRRSLERRQGRKHSI